MIPGGVYVVAVVGIAFAGLGIYAKVQHHRAESAIAGLAAYKAEAEAEAAKLREKAAKVETKVVIQYRDRVKEIRVPEPVEVVREIEVIRNSGCVLPGEWRSLHDGATKGEGPAAAPGANAEAAPVDCASAIETVRENYKRARSNAAQLEALQEWAASVSAP